MNQSSGTYNGSGGYINIMPSQPIFAPPINFTPQYIVSTNANDNISINTENLWDIKVTPTKKKCNEIGCKDGKILLLHSTVKCKKCDGKGIL